MTVVSASAANFIFGVQWYEKPNGVEIAVVFKTKSVFETVAPPMTDSKEIEAWLMTPYPVFFVEQSST